MKSNQLFKCGTEKALLARILNLDEDPNFDKIVEFKVKKKGEIDGAKEIGSVWRPILILRGIWV